MSAPSMLKIIELSSSLSSTKSAQKYVSLYLLSMLSKKDFSVSRLFLFPDPLPALKSIDYKFSGEKFSFESNHFFIILLFDPPKKTPSSPILCFLAPLSS